MRMEQELRTVINQQKEEMDDRLNGHAGEIREIDGLKQKKIDQQY